MIGLQQLSKGCLAPIMSNNYHDDPILQVLGIKRVSGASGVARYRLLLSDGHYLQSFAMLATNLNDLVTSGTLSEYTIIRVTQHITSVVDKVGDGKKHVLIIVDLDVLQKGEDVGKKIGDPVSLDCRSEDREDTPDR